MKLLHTVTFLLVVVGGLNWGLVGLGAFMATNWNVVNMILGAWPEVEWAVYLLVGLSTVWLLVMHPRECKMCMRGSSM